MLVDRKRKQDAAVPWTFRIRPEVAARIARVAEASGRSRSEVTALLIERVFELEDRLGPWRVTIEKVQTQERRSWAEAVERLLWVGVEHEPEDL